MMASSNSPSKAAYRYYSKDEEAGVLITPNASSSSSSQSTRAASKVSIDGLSRSPPRDPVYNATETDSLLSKGEYLGHRNFETQEPRWLQESLLPRWWPLSVSKTQVFIQVTTAIVAIFLLVLLYDHTGGRSSSSVSRSGDPKRGFGWGPTGAKDKTTSSTSSVMFSVRVLPYSPAASLAYLPWDVIIEPHRVNVANITSIRLNNMLYTFSTGESSTGAGSRGSSGSSSGVTGTNKASPGGASINKYLQITWTIDGQEYKGHNIAFTVTKTGSISFSLTVSDSRYKDASLTQTFTAVSKYVRREIRTLTDADRESYFSALHLMYTTPSRKGALEYGESFRSSDQLVYKHLTAAGTTDCDHWHDGAGIVTNHAAFTLEAERSLQSINPMLSMPYWEYPMDSFYYTDDNWGDSPIFHPLWFGTSSPSNDLHEVKSGRFSGIVISRAENILTQVENEQTAWDHVTEASSLSPYTNALGSLRSPWNNNPALHVSRHNLTYGAFSKLGRPGCASMSSCYASTSLAQMNDCLNGYTHGPVHILIGGSWGEGDIFDDDKEVNLKFLQKASKMLLFKMLWRYGWARCPSTCEVSEDGRRLVNTGASNTPTVGTAPLGGLGANLPVGGIGAAGAVPSPTGAGPLPIGTPPPSLSPVGPDTSSSSSSSSSGTTTGNAPPAPPVSPPDAATDGDFVPPEEGAQGCSCHVPKEYIEEYGAEHILESSGVLAALERDLSYIPAFPDMDAFYFTLIRAIQDPGVVGDMLTSAAPQDPIFWPLHGSIERLLGLKRIALQKGIIDEEDFDMTWGYETDNLLYLRGKCDWSKVADQNDLTLPTCTMGDDIICEGHGIDDLLHFQSLLGTDETFTNRQMLDLIHPWNEKLPYTYDSFDYDYCYDFYPDSRTGAVEGGSNQGRFTFDSIKYPHASSGATTGKYSSSTSGGSAMG